MKKREKKKEETISDYDYFLDDSKMPSAEESKKIVIPEEIQRQIKAAAEEVSREFGLY